MGMRRWLPFLFLGLFVYDVAVDAFEADCAGVAEETCCACVCQTHASNPAATQALSAPTVSARFSLSQGALFIAHLSDKSLFHPPNTTA